jgi:choline dehydrogenase-like flavoprotein
MLSNADDLPGHRLRADVCIVGSGAAGLTVGVELIDSPLRVALLDAGGSSITAAAQDFYQYASVGLAHNRDGNTRFRVFGGSTTRWAGQAYPLLDIDFERRNWVPESGWPLDRTDLDPFYRAACSMLNIPSFDHEAARMDRSLNFEPGFDPQLLRPLMTRFSPDPDMSRTLGARILLAPNVQVILGANVVELVIDRTATSMRAVRVVTNGRRRLLIEASIFVLCIGGIETARILLASNRILDGGVGNGSGLVGRYFQDHPGLVVGPLRGGDPAHIRRSFRPKLHKGVRFQPLVRASDELQRSSRLLNIGASVTFKDEQRDNAVRAAKALFLAPRRMDARAEARRTWRAAVYHPVPGLQAAGRHFVLGRPALDAAGVPHLVIGGEQAPNPDSRLALSVETDALGVPRLSLDWRLTALEIHTYRSFVDIAATEFERAGLGQVDLCGFRIPDDPAELSGRVIDAAHHMGTTRMGRDSTTGVVDSDCRVFGVDNLYIGSSAVFPTSGFSNPTLTIMALCIRLAQTVRARLSN